MATMYDVVKKMLELGIAVPPTNAEKSNKDSIFKSGYIVEVQPNGNTLVALDDGTVNAVPVTDETLSTGQKVYILQAENNINIILGSARQ